MGMGSAKESRGKRLEGEIGFELKSVKKKKKKQTNKQI
jgi:hypothetical protein